jgi:hypothetical protein
LKDEFGKKIDSSSQWVPIAISSYATKILEAAGSCLRWTAEMILVPHFCFFSRRKRANYPEA